MATELTVMKSDVPQSATAHKASNARILFPGEDVQEVEESSVTKVVKAAQIIHQDAEKTNVEVPGKGSKLQTYDTKQIRHGELVYDETTQLFVQHQGHIGKEDVDFDAAGNLYLRKETKTTLRKLLEEVDSVEVEKSDIYIHTDELNRTQQIQLYLVVKEFVDSYEKKTSSKMRHIVFGIFDAGFYLYMLFGTNLAEESIHALENGCVFFFVLEVPGCKKFLDGENVTKKLRQQYAADYHIEPSQLRSTGREDGMFPFNERDGTTFDSVIMIPKNKTSNSGIFKCCYCDDVNIPVNMGFNIDLQFICCACDKLKVKRIQEPLQTIELPSSPVLKKKAISTNVVEMDEREKQIRGKFNRIVGEIINISDVKFNTEGSDMPTEVDQYPILQDRVPSQECYFTNFNSACQWMRHFKNTIHTYEKKATCSLKRTVFVEMLADKGEDFCVLIMNTKDMSENDDSKRYDELYTDTDDEVHDLFILRVCKHESYDQNKKLCIGIQKKITEVLSKDTSIKECISSEYVTGDSECYSTKFTVTFHKVTEV